MINRIIHENRHPYFLEYVLLFFDDNVDEEYEYFSNRKSSASG